MDHSKSTGWEPEPSKMGNWRAQLMQDRGAPIGAPTPEPVERPEAAREVTPEVEALAPESGDYKPWILQRARSHPAMMLEFRRYEPRSGFWTGWAIAYPHLVTLEYTSDKLLSLDFGARQVIIEGNGLDELARHIQQGAVLTIQEHAKAIWPAALAGPGVTAIRNIVAARGAGGNG
jgi:hypothetical protein